MNDLLKTAHTKYNNMGGIHMKKCVIFFIAILLMFPFPIVVRAEEKIIPPTVRATGAVLMDAETGRVLWGKNEHEPLSMASTTKIMTAILALESGKMDETVTVSRLAAAAPRVKMDLSPGEKVRLGDLMLALMLISSNDAAIAIAEHISGSVEAFCQQMTEKARELGALNTVFETPNGLDSGDHHSTAYDLAVITRYALTVPGFTELINTQVAQFKSDRRGYTFNNRNRLLHEYAGANGVKTGFTNKAGYCFVGAAKREGMQLISVVLASGWGAEGKAQKWVDTKEILNFGFGNYAFETVITADTQAGTLPITRSKQDELCFIYSNGLVIPMNKEEKDAIHVEITVPESLQAPVSSGDIIGSAKIYIGAEFYAEIPLVVTGEAIRHDFKTSLEKVLNVFVGHLTTSEIHIILPEKFAFPDLLPPT